LLRKSTNWDFTNGKENAEIFEVGTTEGKDPVL